MRWLIDMTLGRMMHEAHGRRVAIAVDSEPGYGLLIRGFGVQVPGGAPVLTWSYSRVSM
jgi:hypothetical protein